MKFQDSSFNGLKVTVGTKSVTHPPTHPPTHAPKAICPINFFKVGGIKTLESEVTGRKSTLNNTCSLNMIDYIREKIKAKKKMIF